MTEISNKVMLLTIFVCIYMDNTIFHPTIMLFQKGNEVTQSSRKSNPASSQKISKIRQIKVININPASKSYSGYFYILKISYDFFTRKGNSHQFSRLDRSEKGLLLLPMQYHLKVCSRSQLAPYKHMLPGVLNIHEAFFGLPPLPHLEALFILQIISYQLSSQIKEMTSPTKEGIKSHDKQKTIRYQFYTWLIYK